MQRSRAFWPLLILIWPLSGRAAAVEVPALGISFAALPPGASPPEVAELPAGYQMTTQLGKAVLRIYRESGAVPAGSDVASPGYRAGLDARFSESVRSADQGAPTALGGYGAWTVVDARATEGAAGTAYTCITYVIVEQHLYRLTVNASGEPRPPEFDALVKALSAITFEPIGRT